MERIKSIDISKGISIMLMTFSHLLIVKKHPEVAEINANYLMIFKMPLFIIISGLLYNNKKSLKEFTWTKADSLIKPTISAIVLIALILFCEKLYLNQGINPREILAETILFIFPLWFIFSLFAGLFIFRFLFHTLEKENHLYKYIVITSIILVLSIFTTLPLRYYLINLSTIIYFLLYLGIGFFIKKEKILKYIISKQMLLITTILFSTFIVLKQYVNISLSLTNNVFNPFFPTLIYSIIGSILILNISNVLAKQVWLDKFLTLCGQSSFFILSFHIAMGNYLITKVIPANTSNYLLDMVALVLTIGGCILIRELFKRAAVTRYLFLPKSK